MKAVTTKMVISWPSRVSMTILLIEVERVRFLSNDTSESQVDERGTTFENDVELEIFDRDAPCHQSLLMMLLYAPLTILKLRGCPNSIVKERESLLVVRDIFLEK